MYPAECAPPKEFGPHLHAECTRMYPNVPECTRMYPCFSPECTSSHLHRSIPNCTRMCPTVPPLSARKYLIENQLVSSSRHVMHIYTRPGTCNYFNAQS